jgi:hypothetical protein
MTKQKKVIAKPVQPGTKARKQSAEAADGAKTKLGQLEGMLRRPEGATLVQLVKALAWQAHSVRGAMSGTLKKKQGLKITASKVDGADRVYRIAG